ncbi:MAG: PEGA domain-containing protein [Verrucomicrobiaceae bacterium]|nr:MAG: PEGA domain-containing protein [Verrucomicrobiaceae bacterium]
MGQAFLGEIQLTVPFNPSLLPEGTDTTDIRILAMTDTGWTNIPVTATFPDRMQVQVRDLAFDPILAVVTEPLKEGELRVITDPPGATVYLDDFNTGLQTPASLKDVLEGNHQLKFYLPGFNEAFVAVDVPEEGTVVSRQLSKPVDPVPLVEISPLIPSENTVNDNIFTVAGSVSAGGVPVGIGRIVISQNGEDYFSPLQESGHFSEVVSLLPGENTLEVRFTDSDGNTGVSRRIRVTNLEGASPATGLALRNGRGATQAMSETSPAGITVVLSWDTSDTDIDLHVFDPSGNHASYVALGGIPGGTLDHDDVDGYGPETFTMLSPRPGTYRVRADYYSGSVPTTARLNIYLGSELIFAESYLLSVPDENATGGAPGNPASVWDAHSFSIGELEIESITTVEESPQSQAIFTTATGENSVRVKLRAPDSVADGAIRLEVKEVSREDLGEIWDVDVRNVVVSNRLATVELTNRIPMIAEFKTENSRPLKYRFIARTIDDLLESQPKELSQDRRSQIRQEYVDKRRIHPSFIRPTPPRNEIVDGSSFPNVANFRFSDFAAYSDFSPSPAVIEDSVNIAQTLRDAWGAPLRVTSGWRNPRRNDSLPDAVVNSYHQTGNAVDLNPTFNGPWPVVVPLAPPSTYAEAQRALKELAQRTFSSGYTVLLHGGNPHIHIQRNSD